MANGTTIPNPNDYAVVVGVNTYTAGLQGIRALRGCVNDATFFRHWLVDPHGGGLDPTHVETIVSPANGGELRPVKDDIEDALIALFAQYLATGIPVGRRLYLWFSGHGIAYRGDLDDCAVLMANASQIALGRAVPGRRAAEVFRRGAIFQEVVLIMDCCREMGGQADIDLSFDFTPDASTGAGVRYLYGFATRLQSITSSERELPHPFDPVPMAATNAPCWHGAFTHAVLEGLHHAGGAAGKVTSASLKTYVQDRVPRLLGSANNQRPDFQMSDDPIVFGTAEPFRVTVKLTDPAAGFEVLERIGDPPVSSVAPGAVSDVTVKLMPGMYLFAVPRAGGGYGLTVPVKVIAGETLHVNL